MANVEEERTGWPREGSLTNTLEMLITFYRVNVTCFLHTLGERRGKMGIKISKKHRQGSMSLVVVCVTTCCAVCAMLEL